LETDVAKQEAGLDGTDLPDLRIFRIQVKPSGQKYFSFSEGRIVWQNYPVPDWRGVSRSSRDVVRDTMDAVRIARRAMLTADGEIAWSWRPDAGVKPAADSDVDPTGPTRRERQVTEANKPGTPGRARISRKTIARGMPVFRRTCGD
jgi:hypothetical protein